MRIDLTKKQKEKIVLSIISILVMISFVNNMFLKKMNKELENKNKELLNLKMQYANSLMKISEIDSLENRLQENMEKYNKQKDIFISKREKKYLIEKITENGKKWGIDFKSINFKEEKDKKNNNFIITMYLISDYEQLINYLYNIEFIKKQIKIKKIEVNKLNGEIKAIIEFNSVLLEEVKNLE
ncbi:MAG: hypothetical protein B6I28_01505 [Fusobacteriia bacterium 4572_132]|nr:MAG: hypothetical protein B6I28_01505 [Fusobacteriia bacterium 4572_132]